MRSLGENMQNKFVKILVCAIAFSIGLTNCTSEPATESSVDAIHRLMLDQTCTAPCWAGIQVGVTGFNEAKDILKNHYGANRLKVENESLAWSSEDAKLDGVKEGNILFVEGITAEIILVLDNEAKLTVQDLIEILDEPMWVAVSWGGPIRSNAPCLGISLHYPGKGVLATLDTRDSFKGVDATQLVSILRFLPISKENAWTVYDAKVLGWRGYQDYCQAAVEEMNNP